jgi:glutathione S-transferase
VNDILSLDNPAFRTYVIAASFVGLHLLALALWTGTVRAMRKVFLFPEDARVNRGQQAATEHIDVLRVQRAHANLLENAVPFFIVGLAYVATGASACGAQALLYGFVAARVAHTIAYLAGRQPYRTLTFATGVLAIVAMATQALRASIGF